MKVCVTMAVSGSAALRVGHALHHTFHHALHHALTLAVTVAVTVAMAMTVAVAMTVTGEANPDCGGGKDGCHGECHESNSHLSTICLFYLKFIIK